MVISGAGCATQAGEDEDAARTVALLRETVPAAVPGVVFLSGGQSEVVATEHLQAMNAAHDDLPWALSFSYGRALQQSALKTWGGDASNVEAAGAALSRRARCNHHAALGTYETSMEA